MNETSSFRRIVATLTIGSFSVAALMGIVALLGGGDFGEDEGRVLLTTLIVGCTSICVLCYLAVAGTRWALVGAAGGIVVALPAVTALVLTWSEWGDDPEGLLKTFGVGVVLALTLAQVCLLLALAGEGRWGAVLWPTIALAGILAAVLVAVILGDVGADGVWRLVGIVAILDVLGTLVTIALAKFAGGGQRGPDTRRLRVELTEDRSAALARMAAAVGRPPEKLVDEAVDALLRTARGSAVS